MQTFSSVEEAFEWWLKNVYPAIAAETKEGKYHNAWRDYTFKKGISQKRMREYFRTLEIFPRNTALLSF